MICVFLAEGFEEMEAIIPVDILRRGNVDVKLVGVGNNIIKSAGGTEIKCDIKVEDMKDTDVSGFILPGGLPGAENLFMSEKVKEIINYCNKNGKLMGAICASPMILGRMGLLKGKKACCYPGFESELAGANVCDGPACKDGNIITGKGPGASFEFSFEVLNYLRGNEVVSQVKRDIKWS